MIFSVTAKKNKQKLPKKEKKKGITRYLHIKVDFEGKNVSHTVLAIKVQPKFFKLEDIDAYKQLTNKIEREIIIVVEKLLIKFG